jgi:hypothetical protein
MRPQLIWIALLQESAHLRGIDIARDERLTDAAHQNEGELAALHLLVLSDQVHQRVRIVAQRRHIAEPGRQSNRRK